MRNSKLYTDFEAHWLQGIVLGDSGYQCKPWLLTPFPNPQTDREKRFNSAQKRTRVIVEMAIGRLKRQFAVLHQEVRLKLDIVPAAIVSCIILCNIIIKQQIKERVMQKFGLTQLDGDDDDEITMAHGNPPDLYDGDETNGRVYRNHIAQQMFR